MGLLQTGYAKKAWRSALRNDEPYLSSLPLDDALAWHIFAAQAEDVLSMLKSNGFPVDAHVMQEVIALHAEAGDPLRAESLLSATPMRRRRCHHDLYE